MKPARQLLLTVILSCLSGSASAQQAPQDTKETSGTDWLKPAAALDTVLPNWVQFHGEERLRYEDVRGAGFKADANNGYLLNRFRFDMDIVLKHWLKFELEVQDARSPWKSGTPAPPYQDTFDLRLAYITVGDVERCHASLRIGRQELAFGDERLIGISNWTNTARTFDGYRATLRKGKFKVDAFAASVVVLQDGEVGQHTPGNYLEGLYGEMAHVIPESTIQPYFLWRRSPLQKMTDGKLATEDFGTTGVRATGKLPLGFNYNLELAIQRGTIGTDSIAAWASHFALNQLVPFATAHKPSYSLEYNFASGDNNTRSGVHNTFDQLYASGHDKLDLADQIGWKNIQHIRMGPEVNYTKKLAGSLKYSDYWLANAHDSLYNSSGTSIARNATGAAGRWVGQELDVTVTYQTVGTDQLGVGFGRLMPGTFLKMTTPGHAYNFPFVFYTFAF